MSTLEDALLFWLKAHGLPEPEREVQFAKPRRWRLDLAWPEQRLAFECEGGTWQGGRHTTGTGFANDCEKYNAATLLGWRVLRGTAEHIESGQAVAWIRQGLGL